MRLGAQEVELGEGTPGAHAVRRGLIRERHRHRYEFNNNYLEQFRKAGLKFSGFSHDGLVEIVELPGHPWFVATQFHPEFTSNPRDGHPLFTGFIKAARAARAAQLPAAASLVKLAGHAGRQRPAAVPDRRPLRHREPRRWWSMWPATCMELTRAPWHALRVQGLVRQGQPLLGAAAFAARAWSRAWRSSKACASKFGVPVLTDVHEDTPLDEVAAVVDVLQTPAFLCRQTNFIQAVARAGKPVNIKKGQFLSPWEMGNVVDKARATGNDDIMVCERGFSFGYNNLVADMRSLAVMRGTGCPVIFDATHSVQLPGAQGQSSGGQREFVPVLARAAVAAGVAGRVHGNPPGSRDRRCRTGPTPGRWREWSRCSPRWCELDRDREIKTL